MTAHRVIRQFRRSELEARIEELIALLDMLDGDCDLEDDDCEAIDEREPNETYLMGGIGV